MPKSKLFNEDEVLTKAKHIFWHKGFEATSMQDLTTSLDLSRSSIYDTFKDKHNLFLRCLEQYMIENAFSITDDISSITSAKEFIQDIFDKILDDNQKEAKGCFMVNVRVEFGTANKDVNDILTKNDAHFIQKLESIIAHGKSIGEFNSKKTNHQLANFIFSTIVSSQVLLKNKSNRESVITNIQIAMELLVS